MLTELCQELRNWFEKEKYFGTFTIENGQIILPDGSLQVGQYFRIVGSVFNDGVHRYVSNDLIDETFNGSIWAMAVPPDVISISQEIDNWTAKYGRTNSPAMSPYNSESFGGYSYSKSAGGSGSGSSSSGADWRNVFRGRLNMWRKILP